MEAKLVERIWLHIGAEKTGTTAIQSWFANARPMLLNHGVLYPRAFGNANHIALAVSALDPHKEAEDLRISSGENAFRNKEVFIEHLEKRFRRELDAASPRQLILSNEHCSSRLTTRAELERLRGFLGQFCEEIRIIIYIREPVEFFSSWYSTQIASGATMPFPALNQQLLSAADWKKIVELWGEMFGADSVVVRRYDRSYLTNGDVIDDFCAIVGVPYDVSIEYPVLNQSLLHKPLIFLREMNSVLPRIENGEFNSERRGLVRALREYPVGSKYRMPVEAAKRLWDHYRESYTLLQREYFPDESNGLFVEPDLSYTDADEVLKGEDYIAIARHLWSYRPRQRRRRPASEDRSETS